MGSPHNRDLCYLEIWYSDLAHTSDLHALWTTVMTMAFLVLGTIFKITGWMI